jgi:soluble lytic murein transglycosylase-like protein
MLLVVYGGSAYLNSCTKAQAQQERGKLENISKYLENNYQSKEQLKEKINELEKISRGEENPIKASIIKYSKLYNVDTSLVKAVIKQESNYNPKAISHAGAIGLMQLMPATAQQLGVNPNIPDENIKGGTLHLSQLLKSFNLDLALAAYNAGANAVKKFGGIPPYPETQQYVVNVKFHYEQYRKYE